jgi:hypothetical protein
VITQDRRSTTLDDSSRRLGGHGLGVTGSGGDKELNRPSLRVWPAHGYPGAPWADWAPGRVATRCGQPRAGTAAIGPVVAGRWSQTPSACIPRPRLPSTTPNCLPWLPRQPRGRRLMRPPGPCAETSVCSNDAIPSARGWRAVREIHDAVFAEADPPHGEEAAEHLRKRSSSAKRDRLLLG